MTASRSEVEVERKWLLRGLPKRLVGTIGPEFTRIHIRQGYLSPVSPEDPAWDAAREATPDDVPVVGRIRSIDGSRGRSYLHTLKSGSGLVRHEFERPLSESAFEAAWPSTRGRRLEKTRWRIVEDGVCWEIDRILGLDIVLLEAEIPTVEAARGIEVPGWLGEVVEREVTDEPTFTNAEMAFRSGFDDAMERKKRLSDENR